MLEYDRIQELNRLAASSNAKTVVIGPGAGGTPVLVVHGVDDEVVAIQQGRSAARLLERNGVATRFVETEGDHHLGTVAVTVLADWLNTIDRP